MTARTLFVTLAIVALTALPAAADPIVLTSGHLATTGIADSGAITIAGTQGFSFLGSFDGIEGRLDPFVCAACFPGDPISIDADQSGSALRGSGTIHHQPFGLVWDQTWLNLTITGPRIHAPELGGAELVTAPFTLTGLFVDGDTRTAITGAGLASVWFHSWLIDDVHTVWGVTALRYDITATPVPEPGTVILLVTGGLVGLVWRRRAQKKGSDREVCAPSLNA